MTSGFQDSIERQRRSILIVVHPCKIIFGIDIPCPTKKELLERLLSTQAQRIDDAAEGNLHGESFCSLDWHQLEVVWKGPHPVRNQVILRKSNICITACDHFRHVAVGDP